MYDLPFPVSVLLPSKCLSITIIHATSNFRLPMTRMIFLGYCRWLDLQSYNSLISGVKLSILMKTYKKAL